ncbi:MAG: hypothetical protein CM1200mP9_09760 [Gammaproteobacteria bacterium]|nr:MAG: hypothetical protein CM1200mP9_09760 [Gammaproteobacteria bacterium]
MDLYTEHGETIAPLPSNLSLDTAALAHRNRLHERYNFSFPGWPLTRHDASSDKASLSH